MDDLLRPIDDLDSVRECFETHGVVGVTGVLSGAECDDLLSQGLEPFLPKGCRFNDAETYAVADGCINRYGVIGKQPLFNAAILSTRVHPNVTAAFGAVYGRPDVVACHDRAAWMRPALHTPAWDTPFSWPGLHLDVNPRSFFGEGRRGLVNDFLEQLNYLDGGFVGENNCKHVTMGTTVQGVLNLIDNEYEDGGFQCVPGMFGPALQDWVLNHPALPELAVNGKYEFKPFGMDAELGSEAVRVPCPAGTLILFDATLPHGTRPNASTRSRAILFLRYLASDQLPPRAWRHRNTALHRLLQETGFEADERQAMHLFGPEI